MPRRGQDVEHGGDSQERYVVIPRRLPDVILSEAP
jgi:hypothetical protein